MMMKRKYLLWLIIALLFVSAGNCNIVKIHAKNKYYAAFVSDRNDVKLKIKNKKLIVSGKFYDLNAKEAWKYTKKMKNKKFKLSKKENTEKRFLMMLIPQQKNFFKNNNIICNNNFYNY